MVRAPLGVDLVFMPSPSDTIGLLTDQAAFLARFEARLRLLNKTHSIDLIPGIEIDFVHQQWAEMLVRERAALAEDICKIFAQDILGELCHGLTRFDAVVMAGNHQSPPVSAADEEVREFIARHTCGFVAVDFCASIYREIMPFPPAAYETSLARLMEVCALIDKDPVRGKDFVPLLGYPDKLKLVH